MSNKEVLIIDNLFKALLIIILVAFLYLYYENSGNDRYIYIKPAKRGHGQVFDKKTGTLYYAGGTGFAPTIYINETQKTIEKDNK